jgi:hypothetical protein
MENAIYATPSVWRFMCMGYFKVLFEELAEDTVCASLVWVRIKTLNLAYTKET